MPSSAADAAGLLASAIADPNPVVFVENKSLYFRREPVPDDPEPVPLGPAHWLRRGQRRDDRRPVAHGRRGAGRGRAPGRRGDRGRGDRPAHAGAAGPGADRRLGPRAPGARWSPTRRSARGGFGAELAAQLQAAAFDYLEAPIQRVGAPFTPVPLSPALEDAYRPGSEEIYAAAPHRRCEWGERDDPRRRPEPPRGAELSRRRVSAVLAGSAAVGLVGEGDQRRPGQPLEHLAVVDARSPGWSAPAGRARGPRASARAPWRRSIASISASWWRWAMIRMSREAGSSASASTNALGPANGSEMIALERPLEQRAAGHLQQPGVEGLVEVQVALERLVVGAVDELADRLVGGAQRAQVARRRAALGGEARRRALEHAAQLDRRRGRRPG